MTKSVQEKRYLPPKKIREELGIPQSTLRRYRLNGALKDIKWSFGGGKPYYEISEVRKIFYL